MAGVIDCKLNVWATRSALLLVVLVFLAKVAAREQPSSTVPKAAELEYHKLHIAKSSEPEFSSQQQQHQQQHYSEQRSLAEESLHEQLSSSGGARVQVIHRYSRSSPFRPRKATRMQMMHETILRDQMRVASIHGQINRMLNGVPTKTTNLNRQQKIIPAQDFQGPIVSGLSLGSGEYFVRISVGTPPKSMYLVVDTGSDILWLQCAQCINCYHQSDAIFNPANSSTYSVVGCGSPLCLNLDVSGCQSNKCLYQVDYGDGSFTMGEFATDNVTLDAVGGVGAPVTMSKIPLGCGHDNEGYFVGAAGLLGLGKGPLSFPNQLDPVMGGKFSYCLTDRETDTTDRSFLIFGEAAIPAATVVKFTPQASNPKVATFYYLQMTGISVGGNLLSIPATSFQLDSLGNGGVIIDSGTSVTRLQTAAYAALRDAFRAGTKQLAATAGFSLFDTCFDLTGMASVDVPTVTLHFQWGADMRLPASNYLLPVDSSNTYCFAFAATTGPSIIGNVQQQGFRVIYDNARHQIGFLSGQCS